VGGLSFQECKNQGALKGREKERADTAEKLFMKPERERDSWVRATQRLSSPPLHVLYFLFLPPGSFFPSTSFNVKKRFI